MAINTIDACNSRDAGNSSDAINSNEARNIFLGTPRTASDTSNRGLPATECLQQHESRQQQPCQQ